jgi:putative two-component system response regulator
MSAARVLIVDDDIRVATFLDRVLRPEGYELRAAYDGDSALRSVAETPPDIVILDVSMPGRDGFDVCAQLKNDPVTRLTPVILVSGLHEQDIRVQGLEVGADDFLTKPFDTRELLTRTRVLIRRKQYTDDLDSAASILTTFGVMIERRDGYEEGHCHRVANYGSTLGRAIGLPESDVLTLYRGGFVHDIGMLAISDSVLCRPGALAPEEYALIRTHTVIGDSLCANLQSLRTVRPIVRHHHERLDGSGYPDCLRGDAIPLVAQIVGIVDAYEALTTHRPYQPTRSPADALEVLREQVGRGWRRGDLVEVFATLVEKGTLGSAPVASNEEPA